MARAAFKGTPVEVAGDLPNVGDIAPPFNLTGKQMDDVSLESLGKVKKILNIFPSMDTDVCANTIRKFSKESIGRKDLVLLNISMDLPFAAKRFCEKEELDKTVTLSAFRSSFPEDYGVEIIDGPLKGLLARAVIILDEENRVLYTELVPEITEEPDYEECLKHI